MSARTLNRYLPRLRGCLNGSGWSPYELTEQSAEIMSRRRSSIAGKQHENPASFTLSYPADYSRSCVMIAD